MLLMTNSQLPEVTKVTFGPLQNTFKSCLMVSGTPSKTFARDEDLFKKWDEMMQSGLSPHGPLDTEPETDYKKARRAYVDTITRAGSLLLPVARSYNFAAQDEMMSCVDAFCKGERDWHLASSLTPAPTPQRPWDRNSRVDRIRAQFEALPNATQKGTEGTLASILLEELSRQKPVRPYADTKACELLLGDEGHLNR
jgi:hypothetical protein